MMQTAAWGRLGSDPRDLTKEGNQTRMAAASVAVDVTDPRESEDEPLWLGIVAFGRQADDLLRHAKGECVSVSGRVQRRRFRGRDGADHEQLQVVADSIISARTVRPKGGGSGGGKSGGNGGQRQRSRQGQGGGGQPTPAGDDLDDPVPF